MKTAYPNTTQPVSITLYSNIPFDNTYKNHSLISQYFKKQSGQTQSKIFPNGQQYNFLNRKNSTGSYIYKRWTLNDVFNFDFKNGLIGSITLELTNEQTNANYLMVVSGTQRWFYFITSIVQSNLDTYILTLETDVLMTYGDEFLEGVKGVPFYTKRKHCRRFYGGAVFSHDYKSGDSSYANVKPSLITGINELKVEYRDYPYGEDYSNIFDGVLWAYVTTDLVDSHILGTDALQYQLNGCSNPFSVICFPINKTLYIKVKYSSTDIRSYSIGGHRAIDKLISQEHYKSAKILPFPPFHRLKRGYSVTQNGETITIEGDYDSNDLWINNTDGHGQIMLSAESGGSYRLVFGNSLGLDNNENTLLENAFVIRFQKDMYFNYKLVYPYDYMDYQVGILQPRIRDPKLMFSPFTKYYLSSSGADEHEIYSELLFSYVPQNISGAGYSINITSVVTAYSGDYCIFSFIRPPYTSITYPFNNYKWGKVGLAQTSNYTYPVGTKALDVFKNTQSETYYQSKIASGITSGLTIAGGVASIGVGVAGAVGSMGMSTPASIGLIVGGATAIASGTAGITDTIKSTNAKIEDLKNTPDSINLAGSSYAHDLLMNTNGLLPYISKYECSPVIMNSANQLFYSFGYEVSRQCYFNEIINEQQSDSQYYDDFNLFGRTIFNYIQLNEDITTKIKADIPYLIKQKISNIFNQGITLWTFFGFTSLNNNSNESDTYDLDRWLFNNYLENKEYEGESYE